MMMLLLYHTTRCNSRAIRHPAGGRNPEAGGMGGMDSRLRGSGLLVNGVGCVIGRPSWSPCARGWGRGSPPSQSSPLRRGRGLGGRRAATKRLFRRKQESRGGVDSRLRGSGFWIAPADTPRSLTDHSCGGRNPEGRGGSHPHLNLPPAEGEEVLADGAP